MRQQRPRAPCEREQCGGARTVLLERELVRGSQPMQLNALAVPPNARPCTDEHCAEHTVVLQRPGKVIQSESTGD